MQVLPVDNFDFILTFSGCNYGGKALSASTDFIEDFSPSDVPGLHFKAEIDGTAYQMIREYDETLGDIVKLIKAE